MCFQVDLIWWQREGREVSVGRQAPMWIHTWYVRAGRDHGIGTRYRDSTGTCLKISTVHHRS